MSAVVVSWDQRGIKQVRAHTSNGPLTISSQQHDTYKTTLESPHSKHFFADEVPVAGS
jgi:hypothetical protein